ncbi:MAG: hypothetical protein II938_02510 [Alphaproteobacteria bacterium]|nr:hypothetical protein [Alphaproteobacteria bacterium]
MKKKLGKRGMESGAIMLEVVAVLSLMGLMGTMLFRQMYLRNQELHNIQMATEIRVVKEAFAAWIQARKSTLTSSYPAAMGGATPGLATITGDAVDSHSTGICSFLPAGYFSSSDPTHDCELSSNYSFKLSCYNRGLGGSEVETCYGIVVPISSVVLPDGGEGSTWNFRRAARVAMLIGADGGVYGPNITMDGADEVISGAVGTWTLDADDIIDSGSIPTYVALTGTDVFQPEIDLPSMKVSLPSDWSLVLNNATAYGAFSAGGSNGCYTALGQRTVTMDMDAVGAAAGNISSDNIIAPSSASANNCRPAFYVENAGSTTDSHGKTVPTGNVYVLNDLHVGRDYENEDSAMRFDKDGMIVFERAKVEDPQTGTTGTAAEINYVLDPKYTSVMNDIKVMSRGGARLSDILPNYILKDMTPLTSSPPSPWNHSAGVWSRTIAKGYCPESYRLAIVIHPTKTDPQKKTAELEKTTGTIGTESVVTDVTLDGSASTKVGDVVTDVYPEAIYIGETSPGTDAKTIYEDNTKPAAQNYYVAFGYIDKSDSNKFKVSTATEGVAYVYCVFDGEQTSGKPFYNKLPTKTRVGDMTNAEVEDLTEVECRTYGGTWNGTKCTK